VGLGVSDQYGVKDAACPISTKGVGAGVSAARRGARDTRAEHGAGGRWRARTSKMRTFSTTLIGALAASWVPCALAGRPAVTRRAARAGGGRARQHAQQQAGEP